jgi:hypothetical protein
MAIVQISRIQHRRGLQADLPQLASAELGWSIDERKLYIGNGTLAEGAPLEGVTEIVTAPNLTEIGTNLLKYTFKGTESGYTSTGTVLRNLQSVLDESISVKSFGAAGNGITNDTVAIDRAIRQVYVSSLNATNSPVRRIIRFPAGTYKITSNIVIPPNCTLVGEGKNNTIIEGTTESVFLTCDSLFQTGGSLGNGSATLPSNIAISGMTLRNTSTTIPALSLYNVTDVKVDNCYISGNVNITGTSTSIRITNSTLPGTATTVTLSGTTTGFVSENNYFPNATVFPITNISGNNYSIGDTFGTEGLNAGGIYSGAARIGTGRTVTLSAGSNSITTLANGSATIDYEINSGTNYRFGTFKYNRSAGVLLFDDEYTEPTTSIVANLFATTNGELTCTVSSTATLKYNIKQFI